MSYEDLLRKYQTFDRTRLFNNDWKVTQQWTTLTVPWTADYHTTKFSFSIEKKTSVVLVLSQVSSHSLWQTTSANSHSSMPATTVDWKANIAFI